MIDRHINQTHLRDENPRLKAEGRGSPAYSSVRRNSRNLAQIAHKMNPE